MPNPLIEFSQSILKFNRDGKFTDSLNYFRENKVQFTPEQIKSNDYLISAMLTALRKSGNIDNAFKFLELYQITIDENTKEIILTSYGWLLWSKIKSENQLNENNHIEGEIFDDEETEILTNHHFNKTEIIQKIEAFLPLIIKVNNEFAYSVVSNLFTTVLKSEKKKPNANWKLVSEFCDLINPDQLHTECRTIDVERRGQIKPMELSSDRENWYAYKSKALMKLGKFQECYEISKQALELFEIFHYSNDIWFARRIALSKKNLGNSADAILELQKILRRKKEWFIQKELSVLYKEEGDNEKAFKYAIDAVNNFGDLEYKVDLLYLLGELLIGKQEDDLAFKHFSLSHLIRIREEWRVPEKLQSALSHFEKPNIPIEKIRELKEELRKYWISLNPQQIIPKTTTNRIVIGKIEKILHNDGKGVDGFIKYDGNKSIYFWVSASDEINKKINLGLELEFKILPATSEKKEKAIQLKVK